MGLVRCDDTIAMFVLFIIVSFKWTFSRRSTASTSSRYIARDHLRPPQYTKYDAQSPKLFLGLCRSFIFINYIENFISSLFHNFFLFLRDVDAFVSLFSLAGPGTHTRTTSLFLAAIVVRFFVNVQLRTA